MNTLHLLLNSHFQLAGKLESLEIHQFHLHEFSVIQCSIKCEEIMTIIERLSYGLKILDLSRGCAVDSERSSPNLLRLRNSIHDIDKNFILWLTEKTRLEELDIRGVRISMEDIVHLGGLQNLRILKCGGFQLRSSSSDDASDVGTHLLKHETDELKNSVSALRKTISKLDVIEVSTLYERVEYVSAYAYKKGRRTRLF